MNSLWSGDRVMTLVLRSVWLLSQDWCCSGGVMGARYRAGSAPDQPLEHNVVPWPQHSAMGHTLQSLQITRHCSYSRIISWSRSSNIVNTLVISRLMIISVDHCLVFCHITWLYDEEAQCCRFFAILFNIFVLIFPHDWNIFWRHRSLDTSLGILLCLNLNLDYNHLSPSLTDVQLITLTLTDVVYHELLDNW